LGGSNAIGVGAIGHAPEPRLDYRWVPVCCVSGGVGGGEVVAMPCSTMLHHAVPLLVNNL
jgi:hypothetical protein